MPGLRRRSAFLSHVIYRFVDCRWSLDDPAAGRRAYLEAHVPGAAFLDVERDLAGPPGPDGRHPLPDDGDFAAAASRAGVGDGVFVIAYGSLGGAERLWWLLRHFGHDDCAVLDLGSDLAAWHGSLRGGEEEIQLAVFEPRPRQGDTIAREELDRRRDELVVVDARTAGRWRGEPNAVDRVPGRIPGAHNAPWQEPPPELPPGELVAYCGSGVTACVVLHRLHLAGRDGRLYPGSWSEWEQYPALPVERSG
jgi:thiosulfate/3-mercaptopyruvate sulfurtransferase